MTNAQKTRIQAYLKRREVKAGEPIWTAGEASESAYLVARGLVQFDGKKDLEPFGSGALVGEINSIISGDVCITSAIAKTGLFFFIIFFYFIFLY